MVADVPDVASGRVVASMSPSEPGDATDTSILGDVGRLVKVAAELFALIEAQVHVIDQGLTSRARESSRARNVTNAKDETLQSALNFDVSP